MFCNNKVNKIPPMDSENLPTIVNISIEAVNDPMEMNIVIIMFIPSFSDFVEKAGFIKNNPKTKPTSPVIKVIIKIVANVNEIISFCLVKIEIIIVVIPTIGIVIIQLFINKALMNLETPLGAFL